ncbi:hypothetical protein DM02DRAFT_333473 [Periconia macrospinosa]|uniref:Heterokaryon incompatibility domain-containing protein n=1 Tax=Periconia macrospinosa TaxID=97972 RepID=A0A2V1D0Q3_9PLEO|nr:hypothetical protein DM02DRAFT_333473 [Periconia macrospinosa]
MSLTEHACTATCGSILPAEPCRRCLPRHSLPTLSVLRVSFLNCLLARHNCSPLAARLVYGFPTSPKDLLGESSRTALMRLLQLQDDGEFSLVEHIGSNIPPYAILSHTWGADREEVTFKDLIEGTGKNKAGYRKLTFCGEQAAKDNLQWFWVDTCCTIQTHHRRQYPTKRVAYAAENGGRMYTAFQYKRINISILVQPESGPPLCSG